MADSSGTSVTVEITWDDVRALQERRAPPPGGFLGWIGERWSWRWDVTVAGMMLVGAIFVVSLFPSMHALTLTTKTLVPLFVFTAIFGRTPLWRFFVSRAARNADIERQSKKLHTYVGKMDVTVDEHGATVTRPGSSEFWAWAAIDIGRADEALYLHYDRDRAIIVPARDFGAANDFADFCEATARLRAIATPGPITHGVRQGAIVAPTYDVQGLDVAAAWMADPPRWRVPLLAIPYLLFTAIPTIGMGYAALMGDWRGWIVFPLIMVSHVCVLFGSYILERRRRRRAALEAVASAPNPEAFLDVSVAADAQGLTERTRLSSCTADWGTIRQCDLNAETAVFHTGNGIVIVPSRVFESQDAYLDFVEKAFEFRRAALARPAA